MPVWIFVPPKNASGNHDTSQFMPPSHYPNHHNHPNNTNHPSHPSMMSHPHHPNHPNPANIPVPGQPTRNMMNPSMDGPAFPGMAQINNQQPQHVPGNVPMSMMQARKYRVSY